EPRYQDIKAADIPETTDDDGTHVRIITGDFRGRKGVVEGVAADPIYVDVSVPPGKRKRIAVDRARHAFAYVFAGSGTFRDASGPGPDRAGGRPRHDRAHLGRQSIARPLRPRRRDRRPGRG